MTELEAYKLVFEDSFFVSLNMSDTFAWGCSESEDMEAEDVEEIIPLVQKYGRIALVAYAAVKRGYDPQLKNYRVDEYWAAKKEVEKMYEDGKILLEKYVKEKMKKENTDG